MLSAVDDGDTDCEGAVLIEFGESEHKVAVEAVLLQVEVPGRDFDEIGIKLWDATISYVVREFPLYEEFNQVGVVQ